MRALLLFSLGVGAGLALAGQREPLLSKHLQIAWDANQITFMPEAPDDTRVIIHKKVGGGDFWIFTLDEVRASKACGEPGNKIR